MNSFATGAIDIDALACARWHKLFSWSWCSRFHELWYDAHLRICEGFTIISQIQVFEEILVTFASLSSCRHRYGAWPHNMSSPHLSPPTWHQKKKLKNKTFGLSYALSAALRCCLSSKKIVWWSDGASKLWRVVCVYRERCHAFRQ